MMETAPLSIKNFSKIKVLCIGDIMLDRFMYGKVSRISPEAPVPVFELERSREMLGGMGNVVANLAALGCQIKCVGVVGKDESGDKVSTLLSTLNCQQYLFRLAGYPTTIKTRVIADDHHLLRIDQEKKLLIDRIIIPRLEGKLVKMLVDADIVLLSDYGKGVFDQELTSLIIKTCIKYQKKVLVDPKGDNYSKYSGAFLVKPNLKEFEQITGSRFDPLADNFIDEFRKFGSEFLIKFKVKSLLVTLGEHGMIYLGADELKEVVKVSTTAREVYDVSGAGDTAFAVLGASLGCSGSIKEAMKLANYAAGIVVGKLGTASITKTELENACLEGGSLTTESEAANKILSLKELTLKIKQLKRQNRIIGFTNGCFDCLHYGHLCSLIQAKKLCDVLVVGLNSDSSIRKIKSSNRPIQDEKTRALLLSSLEYIDYVVIFNDKSALPIVKAISPDVIAKEGYALQNWPEAEFVKKSGGTVVSLDKVVGYSTSEMIEKIKRDL